MSRENVKIYHFHTGPIAVNTYLVFDDKQNCFIVDPGGQSDRLDKCLRDEGLTPSYILLTHGHGDHIGGIHALRDQFPDVQVVINEKEVPMIEDARFNDSAAMFGYPVTAEADKTVQDEDEMDIGSMHVRFLFTPGHTPGGQSILMDDILFSGDTLFRHSVGRTDFRGGDYDALIRSIKTKILPLPDETNVLPGHMELTTVGEERRMNPFLQNI